MKKDGKDALLEEIDQELRTLNKRLKDVMSDADALLSEHFGRSAEDNTVENTEGEKKGDPDVG